MGPKKVSKKGDGAKENLGQKTMDRFPLGILIIDKKGQIEFLNSNLSDQMGVKRDEIVHSLLFDILEPSCIPDVLSLIRAEKGYVKEMNLILDPPSGRPVNGTFLVEGYTTDELTGFMFILKDRKVRGVKREIGFEALEELPLPVTILDRDLEPVFQNSSVDEWIVLPSKGKDPISSPGKERKMRLLECLTSGRTVSFKAQVRTSQEPLVFDITAVPLPSRSRPDQVMEIWIPRVSDGDRPKSGQAKGIEREIIETANAMIIGLDLEGRIVLFNNGASRVLGFTFEEVKGTSWFDLLIDKEVQTGRMEVFQWSIGSGLRTQYETGVRSSTGDLLFVSLENSVIFDRSGNVTMVLMIGQDITMMKRLEDSLREQSEKLMNAMDEVSLYNDLMIHDIHNANAGIMGYLELSNIEGIDGDKRRRYIERALTEVNKSSSIIKDVKVMSLAKPDTEKRPFPLAEAMENASRKFREEWGKKAPGIEIEGTDLQVLSDDLIEEALLRVFQDLAQRGTGKGESIRVTVKREPSMSNSVPEPVHLAIYEDTGKVGVEEMKRILDRPGSTDKGSQGLGLYLVKKIIERYGGTIWVENGVGKKTGISIHILLSEAV